MAEPLSEFFNGKLRGTTIDQLLAQGMDVEFFEDEDIETSDDVKDLMNAVERVPSLPIGDVEKIRRRLKRKFEDSTSPVAEQHTSTPQPSPQEILVPTFTSEPLLVVEQHVSTHQPSSSATHQPLSAEPQVDDGAAESCRLQGMLDGLCSVEHLVDVYKIPEGHDVSGQPVLKVVGSLDASGKIVSGCCLQ
jgi:hypothetical protein